MRTFRQFLLDDHQHLFLSLEILGLMDSQFFEVEVSLVVATRFPSLIHTIREEGDG